MHLYGMEMLLNMVPRFVKGIFSNSGLAVLPEERFVNRDIWVSILEHMPVNEVLLEQLYRKNIIITPTIAHNIVDRFEYCAESALKDPREFREDINNPLEKFDQDFVLKRRRFLYQIMNVFGLLKTTHQTNFNILEQAFRRHVDFATSVCIVLQKVAEDMLQSEYHFFRLPDTRTSMQNCATMIALKKGYNKRRKQYTIQSHEDLEIVRSLTNEFVTPVQLSKRYNAWPENYF